MSNSIFRHSHRTAGKALDVALESVHEAAMFHSLSGHDPAWLLTLLTYIDNARELGAQERSIVDAMDAGCHAASEVSANWS
jgi:hypothetical protein